MGVIGVVVRGRLDASDEENVSFSDVHRDSGANKRGERLTS